MKTVLHALFLLPPLAGAARADALHVPEEFATIQAAIDAAQPGDEIVIAAGSYTESILLDTKSDLLLRGQGKVTLTGGPGAPSVVVVQDGQDLEFRKLRLQGTITAVSISGGSDHVTLSHCRVSGTTSQGVEVLQSHDVRFEHVVVEDTGGDGLYAELSDAITLRHCTFTGTDSYGIEVVDGTGHLVEHVKVEGAGESGIAVGDGAGLVTGAIVRKCLVRNSSLSGIDVGGVGVLVEHNRTEDTGSSGVLLLAGSCIVRNNRAIRPAIEGVRVHQGAHQVLDNRVVQAGGDGIRVEDTAPSQFIADNRILHPLIGIFLEAGAAGCTLVHNRVVSPADDGVVVLADELTAADNRVTHAGEDGWNVAGSGGLFTGNRAKGSGEFDLIDVSGGGNTYVDNVFGTIHLE